MDSYLLVMADADKIKDHFKFFYFFYFEKKLITCSLCTAAGQKKWPTQAQRTVPRPDGTNAPPQWTCSTCGGGSQLQYAKVNKYLGKEEVTTCHEYTDACFIRAP